MAIWTIAGLLWFSHCAPMTAAAALAPPATEASQQAVWSRFHDLPVRRLQVHSRRPPEGKDGGQEGKDGASVSEGREGAVPLQGFRVRISSPPPDSMLVGRVKVLAAVEADHPEGVRSVDFFIDGRMLFSDVDAPYEMIWDAGRPAAHRIEVRAYGPGRQVVHDVYEGGAAGADPSGTIGYYARVDQVEVYVSVEAKHGGALPLPPGAFEVLEEGRLQEIVAVERVSELPLAIGMLVDCSGSMVDRLDKTLEAGTTFIEGLMTQPQDKAFVMSFSDLPTMMQGFTNDTSRLSDAFSLIRRGSYTALYDSVIAAAESFAGVDGRRAVVVLTDGHDEGSDERLQASIAAAQRADVALYPVGVDLSIRFFRERWVLGRLAEATGGRVSYLGRSGDPSSIYEAIAEDLRAQYRITYTPLIAVGGGEWRSIEVRLKGDGREDLKVRARPGYYAQ